MYVSVCQCGEQQDSTEFCSCFVKCTIEWQVICPFYFQVKNHHFSVYLLVSKPVCLFLCLPLSQPAFACMPAYLSVHLPTSLSACLPTSLSADKDLGHSKNHSKDSKEVCWYYVECTTEW